jgi:hypothetical protein
MEDVKNVDTGSETSGEQAAAETSQEETVAADTAAVETAQADETAAAEDAGGAADAVVPPANESRTDFVTGARPGDECTCPDGRKGTVHSFDSGLVCIPNHDQA